jgi:hypothetical protein
MKLIIHPDSDFVLNLEDIEDSPFYYVDTARILDPHTRTMVEGQAEGELDGNHIWDFAHEFGKVVNLGHPLGRLKSNKTPYALPVDPEGFALMKHMTNYLAVK